MSCLYGNVLLECAEFIAFQIFMLYSPEPPKILISSCQPLSSLSSVSHPSPIATFILLFFFYHSFFIALSVPSILLPARLHLFFLTSLSFLPVFQPWLFPPCFSVTLALFCPSLSLSVASFPSLSVHLLSSTLGLIHTSSPFSLFLCPLLFLEYIIFHTSWHHQSPPDPVSTLSSISLSLPSVPWVGGKRDANQPV